MPSGELTSSVAPALQSSPAPQRHPGAFRLDRDGEPPHVAFGWGTHTCIGAPIVRHAGATLLNTFLDLAAAIGLEPGTTPRPYLSPQGNGLDEYRLRLTPALGRTPLPAARERPSMPGPADAAERKVASRRRPASADRAAWCTWRTAPAGLRADSAC